jgi:aspartate/methionine/tyrosine aminotransferase
MECGDLDRAWTSDTRAVLAVSPNNPTGSALTAHDADELVARCAERHAALMLDEVFCDYPLAEAPLRDPPALQREECLLFRLGGLSKTAGLPQVKLGWIAVSGPDRLVEEAADRLELICDAYLSVSTPVQIAARALLEGASPIRDQIGDRVRRNYAALHAAVAGSDAGVSVLAADGGWSAVMRVPATAGEEALALALLTRDGVGPVFAWCAIVPGARACRVISSAAVMPGCSCRSSRFRHGRAGVSAKSPTSSRWAAGCGRRDSVSCSCSR